MWSTGHGECVRFVKGFGLPMLVVGGGGYRMRNVSRAWAYETSILVGQEVSDNIPYNDYFEFYAPTFKLHLDPDPELKNDNSKEYLEKHKYACSTEVRCGCLEDLLALPLPLLVLRSGLSGSRFSRTSVH